MHSTDIVAYTYDDDTYCPPCIAKMFQGNISDVQAQWLITEEILTIAGKAKGIDYPHGYDKHYDSSEFPKVIFADQANDADFDHCANMNYPISTVEGICEQHIAHDESECRKWRGITESDDFQGRTITWTSSDNEFVLEMVRVYPPTKSHDDNKEQWSYKLFDYGWIDETNSAHRLFDPGERNILVPIFDDDEFWSPDFNDAPEIVGGLLGFLSLQPGDTDDEYFANYTNKQIAWRDARAEELSFLQMEQFEE